MRRPILIAFLLLLGGILMPLKADSQSDKARAQEILGRMASFYNRGEADSIKAFFQNDMDKLRHLGQWNEYYEVWTFYINSLIYYSNSKNQALREVQLMFADAMERKETYGQGIAYYTMGNVYLNMNNLDQSADAYEKGLQQLLQLSPLPIYTSEVFSYLGDVLNEQGKYQQLLELTIKWKEFIDQYIKENPQLDAGHQNLLWFYYDIACAQAALGQERLDDAEKTLAHAKEIKGEDTSYESMAWLIAQSQLRLKQGRYAEAFELNTRRLRMIPAGEDKAIFLTIAAQRAEILSSMHRFEESSALYHEMYRLKDSISGADTKNQLNELNTMFHVDELKMEQERTQFHNTLIIVGIILLAMVIFIVFRIIAARRLKKAHDQLQATHEELLTAYDQLEETTTAKERIESDLRIARNIQMGMVPSRFPDRPDLDLYASMTPAKEVGGDLYGYLLMPADKPEDEADKLYFALGDVSGKGVPASLFMAQATRLFRTLAAQGMKPAEIATRINDALSGEDNETSMFVTMFLGLVDLHTGHLDFCNAGHNPPVLIGEGSADFIDMVPNCPIGLWPNFEFEGEEIENIMDRPLFIYTDGLNEAENRQQEQFTDDRLLEILAHTPFESSQQTIEMLRAEVEKHRDGAEPNDDLTMLCVKVISNQSNQ
jgi:serine phosphatase RsbU (regulator of sigma subunit)